MVSAIIVPTAADLAFGIEFSSDRLCEPTNNGNQPLRCYRAHSPYDFGSLALRSFHKAMVQCFASGGQSAYAGKLLPTYKDDPEGNNVCDKLSLVNRDLHQPEAAVSLGEEPQTNTVVPPN